MAQHTRSVDPPSPAVTIAGLTVSRGHKRVLAAIDLSVDAGTITGLVGPSGAGKTTLIRSIVGVQQIEAGTVTVLGHPAGSPPLRSRIGYLTQAPSVYLDLTVGENVRYFGTLYGRAAAECDEVVATVGLSDQVRQLCGNLSGGQLSRASLACAMVGKPDLLVLDEPTVGQDPALREELWATFRELADRGVTLIVSSHVMNEATRCDRLLLIRDGRVVADGTADRIMRDTGTDSMDDAFLALVRRTDNVGGPEEPSPPPASGGRHERHSSPERS
jgi:ABC-2 type transport system ATP-binding protein